MPKAKSSQQSMKRRKNDIAEKQEVNFQKELERLNEIVEKISSKVISLDESLKLYEEGTQIIKTLEDELKTAEEKIEKVITIE